MMNIRISLGLCVVLGVICPSVRAADNPAQAAARVILEQKLSQPDAWEPQPLTPALTTTSAASVQRPVKSVANVARTIYRKAVASRPTQAPTTPLAAPAAAASDLLILIISCLTMSFLLLKLWRQNSRNYSSNQVSTSSRT
jgi:hypothetical protein